MLSCGTILIIIKNRLQNLHPMAIKQPAIFLKVDIFLTSYFMDSYRSVT